MEDGEWSHRHSTLKQELEKFAVQKFEATPIYLNDVFVAKTSFRLLRRHSGTSIVWLQILQRCRRLPGAGWPGSPSLV